MSKRRKASAIAVAIGDKPLLNWNWAGRYRICNHLSVEGPYFSMSERRKAPAVAVAINDKLIVEWNWAGRYRTCNHLSVVEPYFLYRSERIDMALLDCQPYRPD
jgi:hypothetical protein